MLSTTHQLTSPGRLPRPNRLSFALLGLFFFKPSASSLAFDLFQWRVKSNVNPAFTKVTDRAAWWQRAEFYLLQSNAIYKKVFYFTAAFWSGLLKNFYKVGPREHRAPQSPRSIWQDLFHKNRKRNPSRVLPSLAITPQDGFITTNCFSSQSC